MFCEKIAEKADAKELDHDIWLLNFDLVDRKLPVSSELVEEIRRRMKELEISPEELATYINQNEDLSLEFLLEHKIDPNLVEKMYGCHIKKQTVLNIHIHLFFRS